jgi:hypothetical protein
MGDVIKRVDSLISGFMLETGNRPDVLYMGSEAYDASMREMAATMYVPKGKALVCTLYRGVKINKVDPNNIYLEGRR